MPRLLEKCRGPHDPHNKTSNIIEEKLINLRKSIQDGELKNS